MRQQTNSAQNGKQKEIKTRLERVMMLRDRVLGKISVLVGDDAADGALYPKVAAKAAELRKTRPELAEELGLKYQAYESYCFIVFKMITMPRADVEVDESKVAALPKAKPVCRPPVADASMLEPSILERLKELVAKDTGWEPSKSGGAKLVQV